MKNSRRNFIQKTAFGIASSASIPFVSNATSFKNASAKKVSDLRVGIAGYTFAKFDADQSIAMMKRLDMHLLSIKDFHLPLNSTEEKIKEVLAKFAAADIKIYAAGVIYMKTKPEVDTAFEYAKKVGVNIIQKKR